MEEWVKEAHKRLKTLSNVMPESDIRVVMAFIGPLTTETDGGAELACSGVLSDADSYAYKNIEEYEGIVDCKVNEAFRIGWSMARATMKQLRALGGEEKGR
jgi:hypothetical protein